MYINNFDKLINDIIDDFFSFTLKNDKTIKKINNDINFIKYQNEINDLIEKYIKTLPQKKINDIVKKEKSKEYIFNIIKKFLFIYVFLNISINYKGTLNNFINNILEFSKNQINFKIKITNFFNSESNSILIEYFNIINNIIELEETNFNLNNLKNKNYFNLISKFINETSIDFIKNILKIKNYESKNHNIIKTFIILYIYKLNEKNELFKIIELTENSEGEYIFIDIVESNYDKIDFSSLTNILSPKDIIKGINYDIWEYLKSFENNLNDKITNNDKINILIKKNLVTPIVDDFLLYHKDNERYDIFEYDSKKKDDTKLKYIINKIDKASDLYSKNYKEAIKIFYSPYYDRKAILNNSLEDTKIILKFMNLKKNNTSNTDLFNDFIVYKTYPYINFKNVNNNHISFYPNNNVDCIRYVSLENNGEFKQNKKNELQYRISNNLININIVGLLLNFSNKNFKCLKVKDLENLRNKNNNCVVDFSNYLKEKFLDKNYKNKYYYWLFDFKKDLLNSKTYELNVENLNVFGSIYDLFSDDIFNKIVKLLKKKKINLQQSYKIIDYYKKKYFKLDNNKLDELEKIIFNKFKNNDENIYDNYDNESYLINDDKIFIKNNIFNKKRILIDYDKHDEKGSMKINKKIFGICQHHISFDYISKMNKYDYKEYQKKIYEFILNFVDTNSYGAYICKSCNGYLDFNKFEIDGKFDNNTQSFVTYSMPMSVPLEDINEYKKYNTLISILNSKIEKICSIIGLTNYVGSQRTIVNKRKNFIKNIIDYILVNTEILRYKFKERNEKTKNIYNINRNISNLYIFNLENNVFEFSSQDKDKFKPLKKNNIISYVIIVILLELTSAQIYSLLTDKNFFIHYEFFEKYYLNLFEDIKFIKNDKYDTLNVVDFKVFCYALYMISGKIAKNRKLWYHEDNDITKTVSKKLIPIKQKYIITTVIDIINMIIENSFVKENYELNMFKNKFFEKLYNLFNDDEILKKIKYEGQSSSDYENKKYLLIESKINFSKYIKNKYKKTVSYSNSNQPLYFIKKNKYQFFKYKNYSFISNCKNGKFHDFSKNDNDKKNNFYCKNCNKYIYEFYDKNYDEKELFKNISNFYKFELNSFLNTDGSISMKLNNNLQMELINSNVYDINKYNTYDNLFKKYINNVDLKLKKFNNFSNSLFEKDNLYFKQNKQIYSKINELYTKKDNSNLKFINKVIEQFKNIIGSDINILKDSKLDSDIFVIDHDHLGAKIQKPIYISESDNTILFKKNHPFFKTDVLYYTNTKIGRIDVFYDAITKIQLGYKEDSKDFKRNLSTNNKLIIKYSIYHKILSLGSESEFIDIRDYDSNIDKISNDKKKRKSYEKIINNLIKNRMNNLKKINSNFKLLLSKFIYNFKTERIKNLKDDDFNEESFYNDSFSNIFNKYSSKLSTLKIYDENNKSKVMKYTNILNKTITIKKTIEQRFNYDNYILEIDDLNNIDNESIKLLYYFCEEIFKLLNYNNNKFIKISIVNMCIEFINLSYEYFNLDSTIDIKDIKRFKKVIKSTDFLNNVEEATEELMIVKLPDGSTYKEIAIEEDEIDENTQEELEDENYENEDNLDIDSFGNNEDDGYDMDVDTSINFERMNNVQYDNDNIFSLSKN